MISDGRRFRPMTAAKSTKRPGRNVAGGKGLPAPAESAPLSTSLAAFVKDGSDRPLRRLIYDLINLVNQMERNRRHFAAYIGVSEAHVLMMMLIAETPEATVGALARQLNVSSQFVTIEIGDLTRKGIVVKRHNEADRRSMFLTLAAKGRKLMRELAPLRCRANDIMFRSLTEDRARILNEIVGTLIADGQLALHEIEGLRLRSKKAPSAGRQAFHQSRERPIAATFLSIPTRPARTESMRLHIRTLHTRTRPGCPAKRICPPVDADPIAK